MARSQQLKRKAALKRIRRRRTLGETRKARIRRTHRVVSNHSYGNHWYLVTARNYKLRGGYVHIQKY